MATLGCGLQIWCTDSAKNWQIPSQKTTNKDFRMQRFCTEGSTEKRCSSLAKVHSTWLRQSTVQSQQGADGECAKETGQWSVSPR